MGVVQNETPPPQKEITIYLTLKKTRGEKGGGGSLLLVCGEWEWKPSGFLAQDGDQKKERGGGEYNDWLSVD